MLQRAVNYPLLGVAFSPSLSYESANYQGTFLAKSRGAPQFGLIIIAILKNYPCKKYTPVLCNLLTKKVYTTQESTWRISNNCPLIYGPPWPPVRDAFLCLDGSLQQHYFEKRIEESLLFTFGQATMLKHRVRVLNAEFNERA